jgi:hypothetical protein
MAIGGGGAILKKSARHPPANLVVFAKDPLSLIPASRPTSPHLVLLLSVDTLQSSRRRP